MWPVDEETGETGWSFCNLTEINGKKVKCAEDFALAARAASIIGTIQAGYTDFGYLGPVTKRIVEREALLGVSITGMMDNPDILFDARMQRKMARLVVKTNEWMAKIIGVNPCARATCIKPAGTSSCVLGSASGIHPHHAKRYFRRVQANHMEPVLQFFRDKNPLAIESSIWSVNETDDVITFCVEVPPGGKTKNDLSALELLELVRATQRNWVSPGKREDRCTKEWLTHNVSNTINVREHEWDEIANFIYQNRKVFAGITLLPASGDLDYPQAPMVNVLTPREILQQYGDASLLASGLVVDGFHAYDDLWLACESALGLGNPVEEPIQPNGDSTLEDHRNWEENYNKWKLKVDWVRRIEQFAKRYCKEDVRKCTYLLKHVHCWKHWMDLKREYVDVDYTQLKEEEDNTKVTEALACSGTGGCEI
jgi:ribonucleoside-diphosphate reductase alpha chain